MMRLVWQGGLIGTVLTIYGSGAVLVGHTSLAQGLPPIYEDDPVELVAREQLASFPVNTFLESIVVAPNGILFFTSHEDGQIFRMSPAEGNPTLFASIPGKAIGLVFTEVGNLLVTAWDSENVPTLFQVTPDGTVTPVMVLPEAAFLNGLTRLEGDYPEGERYLIADSYRGAIWELDLPTRQIRLWIEHPLLARRTPDSPTPGVNGLKMFNGVLYASNSDQAHIVRIPVETDGSAGEPTLFLQQTQIDDFAFDREGNLYGATHVFNSVIKVAPDGTITTIATDLVGSTAVAFGRTDEDRTSVYVVTNGGMFLPPPSGVVPAEVVRLEVGNSGI